MKKGKIFINKDTKIINNNQSICKVGEIDKESIDNNTSVLEKLDNLFNTNGYIFNTKVKIITSNNTYDTKIASRVGNSIVTLDNDVINIDDIKDIIF